MGEIVFWLNSLSVQLTFLARDACVGTGGWSRVGGNKEGVVFYSGWDNIQFEVRPNKRKRVECAALLSLFVLAVFYDI